LAAEGGQAEKLDFLGPYIKGKNSENCEFEFSHLVIWGVSKKVPGPPSHPRGKQKI